MKNQSMWSGSYNNTATTAEGAQQQTETPVGFSNKIHFFTDVNFTTILALIEKIQAKEQACLEIASKFGIPPPPIELYINSPGGLIFAGFSGVDTIINCRVPIHTIITGRAASAATLLSMVGTKRFIYKHAKILIHQLSAGMWGKYGDLKDGIENCDQDMKLIKEFYVEHSKLKMKDLDKILSHDLYWDAETALKHGLVDAII